MGLHREPLDRRLRSEYTSGAYGDMPVVKADDRELLVLQECSIDDSDAGRRTPKLLPLIT